MNTRDLEYFAKLVEIKNFSQVATYFKVTQPTITMALKRLENHFGIQLIDRDQSHGAVSVTSAGEQLYRHAEVINQALALAETELARARSEKIHFGLPPIIGSYYFPQLAPALVNAGLIDQLALREAGSTALLADLRAGHVDVALLGSSGPLAEADLTVQPLATVPFTIAVAQDHPLAKRTDLTFHELADEPFVTLSEGFVHTKALQWFTANSGTHPRVVFRTPDVNLLKQMVAQHVGIALLTEMAVTPADGLATIPLTDPAQPTFDIAAVTRANLVITPAIDALLRILTHEEKEAR